MTTYAEHLKQNPDLAQLEGLFPPGNDRYWEDIDWVLSGPEELDQYEGMWVAVHDKKVLASGTDGMEVEQKALEKQNDPNDPPFYHLIDSPGVIY